jgi:hypothetical protein
MPLVILHHLLKIFIHPANKRGLKKIYRTNFPSSGAQVVCLGKLFFWFSITIAAGSFL